MAEPNKDPANYALCIMNYELIYALCIMNYALKKKGRVRDLFNYELCIMNYAL